MRSSSCRVGAVDKTSAKITFVSLSTVAPTVTCSGGNVVVGTPSDRYNNGGLSVATTLITITELSQFTKYTYSITQGSDVINGSFTTAPDETQDFSFIVASCDSPYITNSNNPWPTIRGLMNDDAYPMLAMFHIDDVNYVDTIWILDQSGIRTSGNTALEGPQTTGLGRDYAAGWAHYYGLIAGQGTRRALTKTADSDRHYVFQNLPSFVSGGDHAIEDNHCRGALVNGVPNSDYNGCDRTPGTGLEDVAVAEWNAFLGDANPTPLRTDKLHWGCEIGCVKFALFDYSLYSQPYDSVLDDDVVGYGSEQIDDIMTYLSDTHDFKVMLMESPPTTFGQPWKDWHETEAAAWKATFDADDNLNGTDSNCFSVAGDNHALYCQSHDTFWNFTAGSLQTNNVGHNMEGASSVAVLANNWSGQNRFSKHAVAQTGDQLFGGFWHFKVTAGVKIEASCYHNNGSILVKNITLTKGAANNQWTMPRAKFA